MNVLFSLEPAYELNNPFVMDTWLRWFQRMHDELGSVVPGYQARLLAFDGIDYRKNKNFHGKRILLSQSEIRDNWRFGGDINYKIERGAIDVEIEGHICRTVESKLAGFVPDAVILLNDSPWLRKLFPRAAFIHVEVAWLHRNPYPVHWQMDPMGLGKGKVLATYYDEIMSQIEYTTVQQEFIDYFKKIAKSNISNNRAAINLVDTLKKHFNNIVLLPLADPFPFDGETPIFAWIDKLLESAPTDTCYLITQHPLTKALKDGEAEYLSCKYQNVFHDGKKCKEIGTQSLLPHIHAVFGDFSSVANQALLFDVSVRSFVQEVAFDKTYDTHRNPLYNRIAAGSQETRDRILYWLLTHSNIPGHKLFNGKWLHDFIETARACRKTEMPWLQYTKPLYSMEEWQHEKWFKDASDAPSPAGAAVRSLPPGRTNDSGEQTARVVAFYLPQFHPIPENDAWWGPGFTEWTNVAKAAPLFSGHDQPHIPADLGFYDLRLPAVQQAQASMARQYGIYGFCYYHYWFNGKRLLNLPLDTMLASGQPDFPFCLCWANEHWTRAWDGRQGEILMEQEYSQEDDRNHISWLLRVFHDQRYIRIQGKPLMVIYLSTRLPDVAETVRIWRAEAKKAGEELYLCKVESAPYEYGNLEVAGFDAAIEFQPDWGNLGQPLKRLDGGHVVFDYATVADRMIKKPVPPYKRFPCVTPRWDNSPRRKQAALIIHGATAEHYENWLKQVVNRLPQHNLDEQIVFVNAWNEWGEGNHLEPDLRNGRAYLEATLRAVKTPSVFPNPAKEGVISIVILTFNQLQYTKQCVKSIQQHTPEPHEIIFVDNGSRDGTVKWLRKFTEEHPNTVLIENASNLGFPKGCNQGIRASSGEYILLLNNDVVVTENWLTGMLECLKSAPDTGFIGPMTNSISGTQRVRDDSYRSIEDLDHYAQTFRETYRHRRFPLRRVVGFCMLFRRELVEKIGLLDESFGSGNFEDDDFCLRATLEGYRNLIAGDVFIHHYGSRSFIGNKIDFTSAMTGNRKIFDEKWRAIDARSSLGKKLLVVNAMEKADGLNQGDRLGEAVEVYLQAIGHSPDEKMVYHALAERLIEAKRFADALEALNEIPSDGGDARTIELKGYCKEGLEKYDEAKEFGDRALTINPTSASALNLKGILAYKQNDADVAEAFFKQAMAADPGYGEPHTNLGVLYWAAGRTEEGFYLLERGFILSPTVIDIAALYHSAVTTQAAFDRAERIFRDACALHPVHKKLKFLLIDILIQQNKYNEAMRLIEEAMVTFGTDDGIVSAALEIRKKIGIKEIDSTSSKATLSLCMIVKNEEEHLAKCLASVEPLVDEMIVVDTGSTDKTVDIARVFGAQVHDFEWTSNFAEARNFSLSKAAGDWILVLDADEVVSSLDHRALLEIVGRRSRQPVAYSLTTRNYIVNVSIKGWRANDGKYANEEAGTGWHPSIKVRLFKNDSRIQFEGHVHEVLEPSLKSLGIKVRDCSIPIHHYGQLSMEKTVVKGREYYLLGKAKLETGKGDVQSLVELARQAGGLGEFEDSLQLWQKVIDLNPTNAEAFLNLGHSCLGLGRYEEALTASKKAIELDPTLKEAVLNYSVCELAIGEVANAIFALENLLKKFPEYPVAMGNLAVAYCIHNDKDNGLKYLNEIKKKGFDCGLTLCGHARRFMSVGRTDYATVLLEVALEGNYANKEVLQLLAECHRIRESAAKSGNP